MHPLHILAASWLLFAVATCSSHQLHAAEPTTTPAPTCTTLDPSLDWEVHAAGFIVITHHDPIHRLTWQTWHQVQLQGFEGTSLIDLCASIGAHAILLVVSDESDAFHSPIPYVYVVSTTPMTLHPKTSNSAERAPFHAPDALDTLVQVAER